jgi:antitoxin MazE
MVDIWEVAVKTRVQKWGNSLALRTPKSSAIEARLEPDTAVDLVLSEGRSIVSVVADLTLERLLGGVTEENIHSEVGTGAAAGKEAW